MVKSKKKVNKILLINIIAVTLVLLVTASLFINFKKTSTTTAAPTPPNTIQITIDKVTTVSIYAFGPGVDLVESTNDYDLYTAEYGTNVRLQAVNETRIFTDWVITDTQSGQLKEGIVPDLNKNIINFDVTETTGNITVTVNRRNATAADYGKYMMDRFVIVDEFDLLALQNILDGSNNNSDFALFYNSADLYNTVDKKNLRREELRYGYFLIANNFTVFNENFTGIGTKDKPFQGIMCGQNTINSSLFITITDSEKAGESSYGLFKYLGNEAVIRNLNINTTIGITPSNATSTSIYAGGLAGVMNKSTLISVKVSTNIGIESNNATNIYAGGIVGSLEAGSGIDDISDVVYDGTDSKWLIFSHKNGSTIRAGFVAGFATDSYIKEADIIVTSQIADITNDSVENQYTNSKLYLGNVFGAYTANSITTTLSELMIAGSDSESLRAATTNGDACVGGLIGYVDVSNSASLNIEEAYFRVEGLESEYLATSVEATSVANLYAGGIFGYVNGTKVNAVGKFKNNIQIVDLGNSETTKVANYLFEGNYTIRTLQNGRALTTNNGKSITGGIVGKGLINLNGEDNNRTSLALASPSSSLIIEAVQSQSTTTNGNINDTEHASAALVYGSVGNSNVDISNIDIYTNNTTIKTLREIGSKAVGDIHTGGFIGRATGSTFKNIGLYFNDSSLLLESLSYEGNNPNEGNNGHCGGFAGSLLGNSSLTNFVFAGYDIATLDIIGTTSHIESIQNTKPRGNNANYGGENYIGGIVGLVQYATLNNCDFIGSQTSKDYIRMSGHQSPDSAFCGGVVGLIKTAQNDVDSNLYYCNVKNTDVIGSATCKENYNNPDIYLGGIIGAAYMHATNITIDVTGCTLENSTVSAYANELMSSFAGGIIGGLTWESSLNMIDCYVTDSNIKSSSNFTYASNQKALQSSAGGIFGTIRGSFSDYPKKYANIDNCVVIDTEVNAEVNSTYTNIQAFSGGIIGYTEGAGNSYDNIVISNCYSNAIVLADHQNANGTKNIYAIAPNVTIDNVQKSIETTTNVRVYQNFTINGYTFEVVNQQTGTYRIKSSSGTYARINGYTLIYGNKNRATTFTYNNGNFIYNNRYIGFNNNTLTYTTTRYDFSNIIQYDTNEITSNQNINALHTYYLNKNVKNSASSFGTAIGTGPFSIPNGSSINPYNNYDYLYGFDGSGQKFYIEIIDDTTSFTVSHARDQIVKITPNVANATVLAHVWINAKANGGPDLPNGELYKPSHENKKEAAENGWFIFDYVLLHSGSMVDITSDISNLDIKYSNDSSYYKYYYDEANQLHYLQNINNVNDIIKHNYIEYAIKNEDPDDLKYKIKEFTFRVYDNMLALNTEFEITHFGANYKLQFEDLNGNIIDDSTFRSMYGEIELKLLSKHSTSGNDHYNLIFKPKESIEDESSFIIRFIGGNSTTVSDTSFKINLIPNKLQLVDVTYADYTPPLNYYLDDNILGTIDNPYLLYIGSITKFIPVFTKSNDIEQGTLYILESNIEKCNYTISNNTDFTIHSNGELTTGNSAGRTTSLTITYDDASITVNCTSVKDISASYSIIGADYNGLNHATNVTSFYFEQYIKSNYGGVPNVAKVTIGGNEYDLINPAAHDNIKVYEISKTRAISYEPITEYDLDALGYIIIVDTALLDDNAITNIHVEFEFPVVYTISFKLQCEKFNPEFDSNALTKTFKIESGTSFKEFFKDGQNTDKQDILDWIESAEKFGFVFTGFYLVNDAGSINSYGISFEELIQSNYTVNSSNTFYGRWSYLIEIVEAAGTHVKTGFNSAFMQEYIGEGFTRAIQIPINSNQGYIFRIDTDSHYIGKPGVEAHVVTLDGEGNKIMTSIPIEMYQDSADLYFIRPEYITGYLVLTTTVSNSEIIVGEHTSSVTENVTPEDGIITFKYIVNHYNEGSNQSYIYNLIEGQDYYQTLNKEFILDFFKHSNHSDFTLPDNVEIRVYYNAYVNGSTLPSKSIVGTYTTNNDDRVYLTEFTLLDLETPAFPKNTTFGSSLGDNKSVTEVYYFTITPPNGYSEHVKHEIANYVVECGYVYEKVNKGEPVRYLEGIRTQTELANPSELGDIVSTSKVHESSKQEKIYHIVPTRETLIDKEEDGSYTFIDNMYYNIYDIILTDTQKFPGFNYISLFDNQQQQSILESSKMSFNIRELRLTLGYRLGLVDVYGKRLDSDEWEKVTQINVTHSIQNQYIIDFSDSQGDYPYYAFKLDNISTNEIRLYGIDVLSRTNNVLYQGNIENFIEQGNIDGKHHYTLTQKIVGDSRHNGKIFMLAIQLKDKNNSNIIISDIVGSMYININDIGIGVNHEVYLNDCGGKNTAYIDLSSIIEVLNVNKINFNIVIPEGYEIYTVQLLEVTNGFKPASGEVRIQ